MKINNTSKTYPKIIDTSKKYPKVDSQMVAAALGAEIAPVRVRIGKRNEIK